MGMETRAAADTATRILEAAVEVFAENGFKGATTRGIAARAGVNIASIHYHFRDKKGVYLAAFSSHADALLKEIPMLEISGKGISPKRRLEAIIDSILRRILLRDSSLMWQLTIKEMLDPQGAADVIAERIAKPQFKALSKAVSELLGPKAGKEEVRLCAMSILSQIIIHRLARPVIERVIPEQRYDAKSIDKLSKHILLFSVDALKARRKSLEKGAGK